MTGHIHSIETFGTVDGPGVRFVVFFQGCPMRCLYCHNPDTWVMGAGREASVEEILRRMTRNAPFYETGGLTATGGEPLLQLDFLTELFEGAKAQGIHTCLDTSGATFDPENGESVERIDRLLRATDLVMLDIKHMDPVAHKTLTGRDNRRILAFAEHLRALGKPMRVRHVLAPGYTDQEESLTALGRYLKDFDNLESVEILPYHALGRPKYENLGIPYPMGDAPQLTSADAAQAYATVRAAMGK
ncbi:MAG: pyruvate formate lyase-activating protein [Clostridia bacterium]|nr:pyruvate formate lyase-activating protein [Clostridia bacterium]